MGCNCSIVNFVLAAVIFALSIGPGALIDEATSMWIIAIASAIIVIHSVVHKCSCGGKGREAPVAKKRRR